MIIFENSFIEILHYNRIINSVYVPLKTLQIFVNIIINDGWWVGSSYWPLLIALIIPQIIKICYFAYHKRKKPKFYKKLNGKEMDTYYKMMEALEREFIIQEEMEKRGMFTFIGDELIA